jgi:uncharacterized protein
MRDEFWKRYKLETLTDDEWEALCDGCGRCCLIRFETKNREDVILTRAACRLLDTDSCRCSDYKHRFTKVKGCLSIRQLKDEEFRWLPKTCAYRRLKFDESLPEWHPLLSGKQRSVVDAGISVSGRVFSEDHIHPNEIESLLLED